VAAGGGIETLLDKSRAKFGVGKASPSAKIAARPARLARE
jgi:hypothetical protein